MGELAGVVKPSPSRSPRCRRSSIESPGLQEAVFAFPSEHQLIITTTTGVYAWDAQGVTQIFHSGSEGIVAAKRLASGNEMLAVADSQVVVLHEINEGKQSYRLKGSEARFPWLVIVTQY